MMDNNNLDNTNNNQSTNSSFTNQPVVPNTIDNTNNVPFDSISNSVPLTQNAENKLEVNSNYSNNSNNNSNNNKSNKTPFIIFGVIMVIALVLVASLFFDNNGVSFNNSDLINEHTKTLIVFFSHDGENYGKNLDIENKRVLTVGNTEVMSKKIAEYIDADLYELEPSNPYPNDLNELYAATKIEYNKNVYPEIKNKKSNLDDYDVIFIGYPIWHSTYPQIIKTFVRDNKAVLKDKIIVPFNTHAGSGSAGTYKTLFNLIGCSDSKGLNGLAINGVDVETSGDIMRNWLKGLGYQLKK